MILSWGQTTASEFVELLRPHVAYLYRLAYRFTGTESDAEDLVQDVIVKLYPRRKELHKIESLRPWLTRVLYRQFVDNVRRIKSSPVHLAEDYTSEMIESAFFEQAQSSDPGPEEEVENKIYSERVAKALSLLSNEQRALLMLHAEGYTLSELTEHLDSPLGTLKSRLHRARINLRGILDRGDR